MLDNKYQKQYLTRITLISVWLAFTVSLAIWWYIYSIRQLKTVQALTKSTDLDFLKNQNMLTMEGIVLICCLIGGGAALAYLVVRDLKQQKSLTDFFLTFTHELKTPLTNIQLQSETLLDTLEPGTHQDITEKLHNETIRLSVLLENSLYLYQGDKQKLFFEDVSLEDILREIRHEYSSLQIDLNEDANVNVDKSAFLTILRNIARNAVTHGKASNLKVDTLKKNDSRVSISITDNGNGFNGKAEDLGQAFKRQNRNSGSGIGLYISKELAKVMNGSLTILPNKKQFAIELELKGEVIA